MTLVALGEEVATSGDNGWVERVGTGIWASEKGHLSANLIATRASGVGVYLTTMPMNDTCKHVPE